MYCIAAPLLACDRQGPQFAALRSQKQTYEVKLSGYVTKPTLPGVTQPVVAEGRQGSRVLFTNFEIYSADWLDRAFEYQFDYPYWPIENVVRFTGPRYDAVGCDTLVVRNQASGPVAFVHVLAKDIVLLLDLGGGGRAQVPMTPHRAEIATYMAVRARFVDDETLMRGTKPGPDVRAGASYKYSVDINPTGLVLDIQEFSSPPITGPCR